MTLEMRGADDGDAGDLLKAIDIPVLSNNSTQEWEGRASVRYVVIFPVTLFFPTPFFTLNRENGLGLRSTEMRCRVCRQGEDGSTGIGSRGLAGGFRSQKCSVDVSKG